MIGTFGLITLTASLFFFCFLSLSFSHSRWPLIGIPNTAVLNDSKDFKEAYGVMIDWFLSLSALNLGVFE